jgi:thiopurine S-methyltransferase
VIHRQVRRCFLSPPSSPPPPSSFYSYHGRTASTSNAISTRRRPLILVSKGESASLNVSHILLILSTDFPLLSESSQWAAPKLGWHLNDVNPLLEKYTDLWLGIDVENNSVFVPLCGKSVDLAHLASHPKVSHVVGIDIVRDAAEQFASEHPELSMLEYANEITTCQGDETDQSCKATSDKECSLINGSLFRGKGITFLLGDLFDFMTMSSDERLNCINRDKPDASKDSSQFDAIYDRASMIAIEPTKRQDYTILLGSMLRPGGSILLITIEKRTIIKEEAKLSGPPFSIDEMQVRQFYEGLDWVESITLLEERNEINSDADAERWKERGVSEAYELVFLIRKKK